MSKIKFRGKDILTGEMLFGDLLHRKRELLILPFGTKQAKTVKRDSVAQFVGYDTNGKEVYEDDILVDAKGIEWRIHDVPQVEMLVGGVYEGLYSEKFTLKTDFEK